MGVRITSVEAKCALFDSVSGLAFGPVFDSWLDAEAFLTWLTGQGAGDPRLMPEMRLVERHREWQTEREVMT